MDVISLVEFDQEILRNRQTKQTWFKKNILLEKKTINKT
jgi:hypothetical protein